MLLVHNERTKLTAAWLNALAAALIAAGVFAPVVAVIYGVPQVSADGTRLSLAALGCISGGGFLHWLGRALLERLRE